MAFKVLMLTPLFYPHMGGVEKHVLRVSQELINRGYKVEIITIKHDLSLKEEEEFSSLVIYRISPGIVPLIWIRLLRRIKVFLRANIVHCHDSVTFMWYLPIRFLLPLKPVFITFHGWEGIFPPRKRTIFFRKFVEKLCKGSICVGEYIKKWYGSKCDISLYGGVDVTELPVKEGRGALFVGRLEPDSGILTYLEALRIIKEKAGTEIPLKICGDGSLREKIEELSRKYAIKVELLGFTRDIPSKIAECRLFFSSGYLSILEGMALGKPVFSVYDNPLKEDYLKSLPSAEEVMIIAGSAIELSQNIINYLRGDKRFREMIARARRLALKNTWLNVAKEYIKLWEKAKVPSKAT